MLHFRLGKKEKSAKEYRECAAMHMNAVKSSMGTFLQTGVVMVATVVAMIALGRAWFVSNTNVSSSGASISADDDRKFYLATKKGDLQGVYDNNSPTNSKLQEALRHFKRISNETVQELPQFQIGTTTIRSDDIEYIVGDADGISLMVNSTSNVNNTTQNAYVGPGSKGEMTFYIIPTVEGANRVNITVSLAAYGLSESSNGEVTAQLADGEQLTKILCGHMLLFRGKDNQGNYVNQIDPVLGEDGIIRFTFTKEYDWENNTPPIEITLYWIWPYRFENLVYPGQPDSVIQISGDAQNGFLTWVNDHKENIAYTNDKLSNASADMSNSDFSKWSSGYNRGDQLIGDNVAYFIWTVRTEE